jgi:hypothetical protein
MRCDAARRLASSAFDDELIGSELDALERHRAGCDACAAHRERLQVLRRTLRYEPMGAIPDLVDPILAATVDRAAGPGVVPVRPRPAWWSVAAAFLVAAILGAALVEIVSRPRDVAHAFDLSAQVLVAQKEVAHLSTRFRVVERGWNPDVPRRDYTGTLQYRAPESLALRIHDRTEYPDGPWVRNDVDVVVAEDRAWSSGPAACPLEAQPGCSQPEPRVRLLTGREPFADAALAPLDVVVPVASFDRTSAPVVIGTRTIAGREARGVSVTVAQVGPLLDGFLGAGNWRALYPGDRAEVWLDDASLVPLALSVVATDSPERARWGANRGYHDVPGTTVLQISTTAIDGTRTSKWPEAPVGAIARDAGFVPATDGWKVPTGIPNGMRRYRAGDVVTDGGPAVEITSFTDGRAWVKIRTTREWTGSNLFGDLGPVVRRSDGASGTLYVDEQGSRVGVHGAGVDAVVTGSVSEAELRRVASTLGIRGRPVPRDWAEAASVDMAAARRAVPGLLVVRDRDEFATPGIRLLDGVVSFAYAGRGARGLLVSQSVGRTLSPPLDPDARAVAVRGTVARYSPETGVLEWVESGVVVSLRSQTLNLSELVPVAQAMIRAAR